MDVFKGPQASIRVIHIQEGIVRGTLNVRCMWNELLDRDIVMNVILIAICHLESF